VANDPALGSQIHRLLKEKNLETPMHRMPHEAKSQTYNEEQAYQMQSSHAAIMSAIGLDLEDGSLRDTPKRVAKMYQEELFYGLNYDNFPAATAFTNPGYDEMLATNVTVQSFCEHHFLPFIGTAHVAYIPGERFLGLSKFSRIVDFFARRPQVQERLTAQISAALQFILNTEDVAVVIKAEHYCAKIRGVKEPCGVTVTSQLRGKFRSVDILRQEFMALTASP
jgi:GTP cyclohydrolase I